MELLDLITEEELNTFFTSSLEPSKDNQWIYSFYWKDIGIHSFEAPTPQAASMRLWDTHRDTIKTKLITYLLLLHMKGAIEETKEQV